MAKYKNPVPTVDDLFHTDLTVDTVMQEEMKNDYSHYENMFFAFIDVLGFKKGFNREDHVEGNEKFVNVFIRYFDLLEDMPKGIDCYAGQTSDSLYFYCSRVDYLLEYIKLFLYFNLYAMSQDVFFRGGIAKGNLSVKEPYQFYGDSVIYAYALESSISSFPIITIDENTCNALQEFRPEEVKLIIKKMENNRKYLNTFAPLFSKIDVRKNNIKAVDANEVLNKIKDNIKKFEYDKVTYEKYYFLLKEYETEKNKRGGIK